MTPAEYTSWSKSPLVNNYKLDSVFLSDWMNLEATRDALHIGGDAPGWSMCTDDEKFNYILTNEASFWIYPVLKAAGIRMMFYSGETDGAIPTLGSKMWIENLNYDIV